MITGHHDEHAKRRHAPCVQLSPMCRSFSVTRVSPPGRVLPASVHTYSVLPDPRVCCHPVTPRGSRLSPAARVFSHPSSLVPHMLGPHLMHRRTAPSRARRCCGRQCSRPALRIPRCAPCPAHRACLPASALQAYETGAWLSRTGQRSETQTPEHGRLGLRLPPAEAPCKRGSASSRSVTYVLIRTLIQTLTRTLWRTLATSRLIFPRAFPR